MSNTTFKVSNSGTITGVNLVNTGPGYTVGNSLSIRVHQPTTVLRINNDFGETIFSISMQGEVKWHLNKPNEGASRLVKSLQNCIDISSAGKVALSRSYLRGVEKCLRLAKTMTHEELIAALETEVQHREGKLTWQALNNSLENQNDT